MFAELDVLEYIAAFSFFVVPLFTTRLMAAVFPNFFRLGTMAFLTIVMTYSEHVLIQAAIQTKMLIDGT